MEIQTNNVPSSCIYCDGPGPFSDEHVIPAGLGGDDNRFLLKDMVCKECNTNRFSPLELEFLRSSPLAISRLFEQRQGRKRGAKENNPKINASRKHIIDADGRSLEADFGANGRVELLPQLIRTDEKTINFHARNIETTSRMVEACRETLGSSVVCAFKHSTGGQEQTMSAVYEWESDTYVEKSRLASQKIRGDYIWLSFDDSIETIPGHNISLFQRMNGQLVLKTNNPDSIVDALNFFRKAVAQLNLDSARESNIENPLVSMTSGFSIDVLPRVFGKIAFNILAHLVPREYLSHPEFAPIKQSIVTGEPRLPFYPQELIAHFDKLLKRLTPEGHHSFLVSAAPSPLGGFRVYVVAQLYGANVQLFMLGASLPRPPAKLPALLLVDYNEHRIRKLEPHQFLVFYSALPK